MYFENFQNLLSNGFRTIQQRGWNLKLQDGMKINETATSIIKKERLEFIFF